MPSPPSHSQLSFSQLFNHARALPFVLWVLGFLKPVVVSLYPEHVYKPASAKLTLTHMLLCFEFQIYPIDLQDCLQKKTRNKPPPPYIKINKKITLTLPVDCVYHISINFTSHYSFF